MSLPESVPPASLLDALGRVLAADGILALLRVLNARTPHRFTGIYRYDPPTLRNVFLVDAYDASLEKGTDVPMADAYCVLLSTGERSIVFDDVSCGARFAHRGNSTVVSYCGVLLATAGGRPFGSLCHFDIQRCDHTDDEVSVLAALAPAVMARLETVELAALTHASTS